MLPDKSDKATPKKNITKSKPLIILFKFKNETRMSTTSSCWFIKTRRKNKRYKDWNEGSKTVTVAYVLVYPGNKESWDFKQFSTLSTILKNIQLKCNRTIRFLGIYRRKDRQGFYWENYTTLLEKVSFKKVRDTMLMDREIEYFKDVIVFKWICKINVILFKPQWVFIWN